MIERFGTGSPFRALHALRQTAATDMAGNRVFRKRVRHSGANRTKNQACVRNECASFAIPHRGERQWRYPMEPDQDNDAELVASVAEEFVGELDTDAVPYLRTREAASAGEG